MISWLTAWVPLEGFKIGLVLFLSFLMGLEREEHSRRDLDPGQENKRPSFGGVRTFPLIGLTGYGMALLSGSELLPLATGFLGVVAFLLVSYQHKLQKYDEPGVTTEASGLVIYIVGALVSRNELWIATTMAIAALLLLELKAVLESLSQRMPEREILTFTKFLVLTAVILPIVPNRALGPFGFNPFKAWLIVVAASAISYISYMLQAMTRGQGGIFLPAILGGAYSSTVTTIVLAKRAREEGAPGPYAGGILMASGAMYFRILVLVGLFSRPLLIELLPSFMLLGVAGMLCGWLWSRKLAAESTGKHEIPSQNPLALSAAFLFALMFTLLLAATHYATVYFGRGGVYGLAGLSGLVDITPFILGLTQSSGGMPQAIAAAGIVIAAASNNFVKGVYALGFGGRKGGLQALELLWALALLGLLPLAFLAMRPG